MRLKSLTIDHFLGVSLIVAIFTIFATLVFVTSVQAPVQAPAAVKKAVIQLSRYEYLTIQVVKIVDADTIDLIVDLGFGVHKQDRFRLFGIDAWEVRGPERPKGLLAKAFFDAQITKAYEEGGELVVRTVRATNGRDKQGKYGRYLATIIVVRKDGTRLDLNELLVKEGHAEHATY